MTRINVVSPSELSGKHLVAEYRELNRIYGLVIKAISRGESPDDKRNPSEYTLGTGHCRFFYSRLSFLFKRQKEIYDEMLARGYKPSFAPDEGVMAGIDDCWKNDYVPTVDAIETNRFRIAERSGNGKLR